jgi:hypothetical protein
MHAEAAHLRTADAPRSGRRLRHLLVAAALLILAYATVVERSESVTFLELSCSADSCVVTIDGRPVLAFAPPGPRKGGALGLYSFAPWERESPQEFRNVSVRSPSGVTVRRALQPPARLSPQRVEEGWRVVAGDDFARTGTPGTRSTLILGDGCAADFVVKADLVRPSDAGILFHASGPNDGTVLAVRQTYNDILVFRLRNGEPGPVHALAPLTELTVGRESVRLGGLVARILLATLLGLGVLRWLGRQVSRRLPRGRLRFRPRFLDRKDPPAFVVPALLAASVLLPSLIALHGLEAVPHVADETAYLFQAKIFAAGRIWAPPPPAALAEFFEHEHVILAGDRWFGKYPPLYPALLALGLLAGAPWAVNPILAALTGWVVFLLGRELAGWSWGLVAWLLLLTSPFFLIMSGTFMSHAASALFVTAFLWLTIRTVRYESLAAGLGAGACVGLALFTRPYTALIAGLVGAAYGLFEWNRRLRPPWMFRALLAVAVSASFLVAAYVFWNAMLYTVDPQLGTHALYNPSDRLGFGPDKGQGWLMTWGSWGHTPAKAFRATYRFLEFTAEYLFGWPWLLSFSLALAPFLWGRARAEAWLLASLGPALALGHMLYWATQHIAYGARYWYAAVPGLAVLSALGVRALARRMRGTALLAGALAGAVTLNLGSYLPLRLAELPEYGAIGAGLRREVERRGLEDAVVFVRTEGVLYNDGFFMNDPLLRGNRLFVRDLGERNAELLDRYPGLHGYLWDGRALTPLDPSKGLRSAVGR